MEQQLSKSDKQQCELEEVIDKKFRAEIHENRKENNQKEGEALERQCKEEKLICSNQETFQDESVVTANVHSDFSFRDLDIQNDEIMKIRPESVQCNKQMEHKKTEASTNEHNKTIDTRHGHVDEKTETNMHCVQRKVQADKIWHVEEKDRFEDEDVTKHIMEKTEKDDFKMHSLRNEKKSYVLAHAAVTQEPNENIENAFILSNKAEINSKDVESGEDTFKCMERDMNGIGKTNRIEDIKNDSRVLYQKKCLSIYQNAKGCSNSTETVSCKLSVVWNEFLVVQSFIFPPNRLTYVHIYVIGVPSTPLLCSFGDQRIIKNILETPQKKYFYLQDEHFRLATFSLSPYFYELGDIMRLSAKGFYYDIDGQIRCFCCRNSSMFSREVDHDQHCALRDHAGASMMQYGESAPEMLLPTRNTLPYMHSQPDFIQVHLRSIIRLGRTQQVSQESGGINEGEIDNLGISVRRGRHILHPRTSSQNDQSNNVSLLGNSNRQEETHQLRTIAGVQNSEESSTENHVQHRNEDFHAASSETTVSVSKARENLQQSNVNTPVIRTSGIQQSIPAVETSSGIQQSRPSVETSSRIQQSIPAVETASGSQHSIPAVETASGIQQSRPAVETSSRIQQSIPAVETSSRIQQSTAVETSSRIQQSTAVETSPSIQQSTPAVETSSRIQQSILAVETSSEIKQSIPATETASEIQQSSPAVETVSGIHLSIPAAETPSEIQQCIPDVEAASGIQQSSPAVKTTTVIQQSSPAVETASEIKQCIPDVEAASGIHQSTLEAGAVDRIASNIRVVEYLKHPDYVNVESRDKTYQGWPDYLDQTPRQMSEAGFFFVGVADFTRCFCCGGGLRNWEPGDDPVLEHTRWFPRCEYINKLKGEKYVAAVQRRHEQHMAEQQRQQIEVAQRRDESCIPPDPMTIEAASQLIEIGYTEERTRQAIIAIRQQTGQSTPITEQVLTWLLDNEEQEASGITTSVSSASRIPFLSSQQNDLPHNGHSSEERQRTIKEDVNRKQFQESLEEENNYMKSRLWCRKCQRRDSNIVVIIPCGHRVVCDNCIANTTECPKCKNMVEGAHIINPSE